ncbi:MAG: hypothetical protein NTZ17_05975 [Phycisphaerae bacterium]|nr:hypothetical protein [Phycisphaerae bacterium]
MELVIKMLVTLVAAVMVWGIVSFTIAVWRSHIDPQKTFSNVIAKLQEKPTELLATRDPNLLYQAGEVVGRVVGEITEAGDFVVFAKVSDTSNMDRGKDIEFRRLSLRIEGIERHTGVEIIASDSGSSMRTAVMSNVRCRILSKE